MPSWIKYFKVNINHVRTWLLFLKGNNPEYRNIVVSDERIQSYVDDSNPVGDVSIGTMLTCVEDLDEDVLTN